MTIVPMRWWDLAEVAVLEQQVFAGDESWSLAQLWAELAGVPGSRHYLVARQASAVVGYAGMATGPDAADVMTLVVAPGCRRQRVGSRLLSALLVEAGRRGVPEVLLEVRADNDAALALYAAAGFERLARRRGYYGGRTDGYVLRRRLREGPDGPA